MIIARRQVHILGHQKASPAENAAMIDLLAQKSLWISSMNSN